MLRKILFWRCKLFGKHRVMYRSVNEFGFGELSLNKAEAYCEICGKTLYRGLGGNKHGIQR